MSIETREAYGLVLSGFAHPFASIIFDDLPSDVRGVYHYLPGKDPAIAINQDYQDDWDKCLVVANELLEQVKAELTSPYRLLFPLTIIDRQKPYRLLGEIAS